jgi:hypothetical protein
MSKRPSTSSQNSGNMKMKHMTLSIKQKNTVSRLDGGMPVKRLCDEFSVGISTIYNIRKQKEQLLKDSADSDVPNLIANRKTIHQSKMVDVDMC